MTSQSTTQAPSDTDRVLDALLLLGGTRGATGLSLWLTAMGWQRRDGGAFEPADVTRGLQALLGAGAIAQHYGKGYAADTQRHAERLQALLLRPQAQRYWRVMVWLLSGAHGDIERLPGWLSFRNADERLNLLRLLLASGLALAEYQRLLGGLLLDLSDEALLVPALLQPWLPEVVAAMDPALRDEVLGQLLGLLPPGSAPGLMLHDWLLAQFHAAPNALAPALRGRLADDALQALDLPLLGELLQGLDSIEASPFEAAKLMLGGRWPDAAARYEQALVDLRKKRGVRRGVLGQNHGRLYVLSLLAQDSPRLWEAARKFCIAESGSRKPTAFEWWGLWAHAVGVRLGEESPDDAALAYIPGLEAREHVLDAACNRLLLAAWLGRDAPGWEAHAVQAVVARLQALQQHWLAALVAAAAEALELGPVRLDKGQRPQPVSFLGGPREAWRDALAAIAVLDEVAAPKTATAQVELAWQLELDAQGRVQDIQALERSLGARGQLKLKPVGWAKLKKSSALLARDGVVLRHVERPAYGASTTYQIDVSQAAIALVGHPGLMFADAPGQWVELVEAQPELEVLKKAGADGREQFEFSVHPPLVTSEPPRTTDWLGSNAESEIEKRNSIRLLRDGPQHARLIRISAAQRRVAELVSQGWAVPAEATAELGAALQVLSGHFQLHSDAAAGQLVTGDSRLRARLSPLGEGLQLQLVAQPFGDFGPAVTPGLGRARLMCMHEGLSLATERDLAAEQAHRLAVLDALPFLDPELGADAPWLLDDPEQALHAVELLPGLPGVAALDWPKGRPLRVQPLASAALTVNVASGRDWLALQGQAQLDEQRVLDLQQLIALARASRSRFVSLGDGQYLALSEQLRQQLRDLDALGQTKKDQLQLPTAVASWLDETLDGMQVEGDSPWRARMDALAQAAALQPAAPPGLRAELRDYQLEGYAWMSRLAHAGLGACLADDMGLGKTVQTLGLLIARADLGPALVLAPTSVCANWLAEGEKFAPGLRCSLYGEEGDREAQIAAAAPGDVLIASYALAQIDGERFADKHWATLVMDEAQALKNAATKRAMSVAEFSAGFRLALSGTPVENRLSDLWSIMNLINPGLLGSAAQFNERFAGPIERQQDPVVRARLRRLVSPFLLRRTKAQVLQDLPPRTEIVHLVQPGPEERSFLEALRRNAQDSVKQAGMNENKGGKPATMQVLAELMRLRRAACDPRLVAPELGLAGAKMAEFERIVRELVDGQHKALVFSQFTDFLKLLAERLDSMGLAYQYLDGSTPAPERARRVAAFQKGEGELFLISLKAGGFGLNLTMADYVLIVDPWWNPAAEDQAMGRAHRMGQQRPVTVYRLVTAGSVEESILALHRDKRGLADGILEGQDEATVLDARALAELLRG